MDEADHLREDIEELRFLIDSALDRDADRITIQACAELLRERLEQLRAITAAPVEGAVSTLDLSQKRWL
jgi:hypothetical protein